MPEKTMKKADVKSDAKAVKSGDKIKADYTGTFDDGTVFDTSVGKHPFEFKTGSGEIIKGFDTAVIGMKIGEEKSVNLAPKDAYGDYNPSLIHKVPRQNLPKGQEPKAGMMLVLKSPDGRQFPARITEVTDSEVTIDLNHPLAGKSLNFKIKLLEIA